MTERRLLPSGRVSIDPRAVHQRVVQRLGATFTDPRLAAAVVDRLTFRALIIETGTDSYRLRTSRAAKARSPRPDDGQGR